MKIQYSNIGNVRRMPPFRTGLMVGLACLVTLGARGASLESQWKYLPEVNVKPEATASGIAPASPAGGNKWKDDAQNPDRVPVKFYGIFKAAECDVSISLAGSTITFYDEWTSDDPENPFLESSTNTVYLKPYETYQLRLFGENVYSAEGHIEPMDLNNLFSSPSAARQPARLYRAYWWNKDTEEWEKICGDSAPKWGVDSWEAMDATFQVQIRPDLGVRPVTKPGVKNAAGEDQGDDAWTRDEPAIDATTAPGDGEVVTMGSARNGNPASVRFSWSAFMGRLWSGAGAGRIRLTEFGFSTNAYSPRQLNYSIRSIDTNEVMVFMDLDETNCLSQVKAPQALADVELLYGPALFLTNDLVGISTLVTALTNHASLLSEFLWTNLSTQAQQVLSNTNSSSALLHYVLLTNFNSTVQGGSIFESNRFAGITLSGRTKRLRLTNPSSGEALVRLNRFLLEDGYATSLARLQSTSFDLKYYLASLVGPLDELGFLTLTNGATPFVTWRIGLPDGTTNQWRLQEIRNSTTNTTLLTYTNAGVWILARGTGNEARIETRTITTNVVGGVTNSVEVQAVKNGAGTISDRTTEVFQSFDWGYELVTVTNDPGGADLVTEFNYFNDTNYPATYGKIESITYPDGYWERREYSDAEDPFEHPLFAAYGALVRIVQPWQNTPITTESPDCFVTDYDYNSNLPGSYRLVKWHDPDGTREPYAVEDYISLIGRADKPAAYTEVALTFQDPCVSQNVITDSRVLGDPTGYSEWQESSYYAPNASYLAGQMYSKVFDRTQMDSYDYEFGSWNAGTFDFTPNEDPIVPDSAVGCDLRQTIFHGIDTYWGDVLVTGPSGANIDPVSIEPFRATKEVRIIKGGNLAAKELYVYQGDFTNFALIDQVVYQRDSLGHATNVFRRDPTTTQSRVIYKADWKGINQWPADLKLSETDEHGTVLTHTHDSLKRLKTSVKQPASGQSSITNTLAYDAANRVLTNSFLAGSLSLVTVTHYDLAGRKTDETDTRGMATSHSYQSGGRITTTTHSSGASTVISNYLDRRVASITGSAVTNQFFEYTLDPTEDYSENMHAPRNVTTIRSGSINSPRWVATHTNKKYQRVHEVKPAFQNTNALWMSYQTTHRGHPDQPDWVYATAFEADGTRYPGFYPVALNGFVTAYEYDWYGQCIAEYRNLDVDAGAWYRDLDSKTRIITKTNLYSQDGSGHWFHVDEKWTYPYDNGTTPTLTERSKTRLTGFTATQVSEVQKFDADTNQTTVKVAVDLANKKVIHTTTIPQSSLTATQIVVNGLLQTESTPTVAATTTHYFDALGREIRVVDPLGNQTGTRYDATTGQVVATTNALGLVTSMEYYSAGVTNAGLLKCLTNPAGKKTWYNYNGFGQITHIWGDLPYPEKRGYNEHGDLITLTTYRGGSQWTASSWPADTGPTADVTQWLYDEATGLLTNKTDAASQSVKYDYHSNYLPKTRVWARGLASTNVYCPNGDLARIDYSDGSSVVFTNEVYATYDRMARPRMVSDASGTNVFTYDHAGRTVSIACTDGLLSGITVSNHFNPTLGRDALTVFASGTPLVQHAFGYDAYGRLGSLANGDFWASYAYKPNSDLLQTTTCKSNTTTILTTSRSWEYGSRLSAIVNEVYGLNVSSHSYTYDALDRRIRAAREDGSYWQYDYNDRNELTGARHHWLDAQPVAGQQFGYAYDNLGNRKTAQSGGDNNGLNLRTTGYTANNLNQYTAITNQGYEDILGVALATNSVWVNGGLTERKVEYFRRELNVANGSGPLWTNVSVASGGVTNIGGLIVPDDQQPLTYDLDGNLTFDGTWTYEWDAENRLRMMTMTNVACIASSNRLRLEFAYDYQGRRVQKIVSTNSVGSTFVPQSTNRFVYDGWNLITVLNPQSSILQSFTWGQDLSGTMDKAGGIGGLLLVTSHGSSNTNAFVAYDGNGNVMALVRAGNDPLAARYEYSAYGELLRATGPLTTVNPFRFSSKFEDKESGLAYYGYRYYSSGLGRFVNRDPVDEEGGLNLYAMAINNLINSHDPLGMTTGSSIETGTAGGQSAGIGARGASSVYRAKNKIEKIVDTLEDFEDFKDLLLGGSFDGVGELQQLLDLRSEVFGKSGKLKIGGNKHHLIPQAVATMIRKQLGVKGLDVHDFTLRLEKIVHRRLHKGRGFGQGGIWNGMWTRWIDKKSNGKDVTKADVERFMNQMRKFFGLDKGDLLKY